MKNKKIILCILLVLLLGSFYIISFFLGEEEIKADTLVENEFEVKTNENLDMVMPVHCTGIKAICDLKSKLGDSCVVATAGDSFDEC